VRWCAGGKTRRESAGAGVLSADADVSLILIHDAARPFVSEALIDRVLEAASRTGAALPVLPVVDTIKRTEGGRIVETVERSGLGLAQTPQGFDSSLIRELHAEAARTSASASDDVALCEMEGHPIAVVEGDPWNLKITTAADLALAEWLVESGRIHIPGARSDPRDPV
jgi:2-C-methyl-D-erythritol 4-phosphate cytidylyltransferase